MDKMWMTSSDGETEKRVWSWVVWGDKEGCILFDNTYQFKGHAIRRAKKIIEEGNRACVTKSPHANYYSVRFGNALSDLLRGVL
jgi:hypothetical protein